MRGKGLVTLIDPFGCCSKLMPLKIVARVRGLNVARLRLSSPPTSACACVWQPMHWLVRVQVRVEVSV